MTVYVGKNVEVTIQNPVEEPISDRLIEIYNYVAVNAADTGSHEAYHHSASSEPSPPFGVELTDAEYDGIRWSEDTRYSKSTTVNLEYAMMLFRIKCGFPEADVKKIVFQFEGYGTAPAGNGVTMKIWDHVSAAWGNAVSGTSGSDETLTITLTANLGNYIDANGYIYVLVRTTNPSDGTTAAVLYCDYAECYVTRANFTVTYTPISDKDLDGLSDEPEHVTVEVNGTEVSVSSVNDSTGEVVLTSGDFNKNDYIVCKYRYDSQPYVAQELTLEPKQRIEGIDGLGSDTIQIWAALIKEINGSIKEVYKPGEENQLKRILTFSEKVDIFNNDDDWEAVLDAANFSIENGTYTYQNNDRGISVWNQSERDNVIYQMKMKMADLSNCRAGIICRYLSNEKFYYFELRPAGYGARAVLIYRNPSSGWVNLCGFSRDIQMNTWYDLKLVIRKENNSTRLACYLDGKYLFATDHSAYTSGKLGVHAYACKAWWDDATAIPLNAPRGEGGMIIKFDDGSGNVVKVGLDGVVFPEGSLPAPKNEPVYVVTPFKAQSIKVIT